MFVVQSALSERDARDYYAKKSSDQDEAMNALTKEIDDLKEQVVKLESERDELLKKVSDLQWANETEKLINSKLLEQQKNKAQD